MRKLALNLVLSAAALMLGPAGVILGLMLRRSR